MKKVLSIILLLVLTIATGYGQTVGNASITGTGAFSLQSGQLLSVTAQLVGCASNVPMYQNQPISITPNQTPQTPFTANGLQQVSFTLPGNDKVMCGGQNYTLYAATWLINGFPAAPTKTYRFVDGQSYDLGSAVSVGFVPPQINNTTGQLCTTGKALNGFNSNFTPICQPNQPGPQGPAGVVTANGFNIPGFGFVNNLTTQSLRVNVTSPTTGLACANPADPTGTLDSTCAINAAVNFAVTNPQGAHSQPSVYVPAGTYHITSHINLPCSVHFVGDGPSTSIILQFTNTENVVTDTNSSGNGNAINPFTCNGSVENMSLLFPNGSASVGTALELNSVVGSHFLNLRLGGDRGRAINVIGSSERNTFVNMTIDSTEFPIVDHGNEEKYFSTLIASPGFTFDNLCFGRNCGFNHQGLPSSNFTVAQVLNSASGNGVVATYVVTGENTGSTPNGASPLSAGHFFTVGGITDATGLDGTFQSSAVFNGCAAVTNGVCTTTSTTQYVVQAPNSTVGVAATAGIFKPTIVPDHNAAVWFGAQMQYFIGGSIKVLWAAGAFLLDGAQGFVEGTYLEGYPSNGRPTLDPAVSFYGVPWNAKTRAAMSSATTQAVPVNALDFIPDYVNDPTQIGTGNLTGSVPYKVFPCDFVPGGTAQSGCAPTGVTQGMFEVVQLVGASDGAVHLLKRNQSGSTAPSGTLWPAGSVIERTNDASVGTFTFNNNHIDAVNGPSALWAVDCVDATPNECAAAIAGAVPDGFVVPTATQANSSTANQPKATMSFIDNAFGNNNVTEAIGASAIKCNSYCGVSVAGGAAGFKPMPETAEALNGQLLNQPPFPSFIAVINTDGSIASGSLSRPEGGQVFNNPGFNTQNRPFTNYFGTQIFGNKQPSVIGAGPHGQNFPGGYQYTDSYCFYDIPPVGGTHSLHRFCVNGGPDNTSANMGWEDDYWNTTTLQWVTADSCVGTSSGQGATCTIGTASKLQAPVFETTGTTFTSNGGCTESNLIGGATAGQFKAGATACTIQITFGVVQNGTAYAVPHGADCSAHDITNTADLMNYAGLVGTTGVKFTGTVAVNDTITWSCQPY
jgi:hypothetical protein